METHDLTTKMRPKIPKIARNCESWARFREVKGLRILGPAEPHNRVAVFSFVIEKRDALDIVKASDAMGIAVRGGDLASLPILKRMGVTEAVRASCYAYTAAEVVDLLVAALQDEHRGLL